MTAANSAPVTQRNALLAWFLNPYIQISLGSLLTCAAEMLLKQGATAMPQHLSWLPDWFDVSAMLSGWTWLGIASYILSMISWLYVLRIMPLNIAYAMVNVAQVLVPLGDSYFLHEHVSLKRWAGIGLVMLGLYMLLDVTAKVEKKL